MTEVQTQFDQYINALDGQLKSYLGADHHLLANAILTIYFRPQNLLDFQQFMNLSTEDASKLLLAGKDIGIFSKQSISPGTSDLRPVFEVTEKITNLLD